MSAILEAILNLFAGLTSSASTTFSPITTWDEPECPDELL